MDRQQVLQGSRSKSWAGNMGLALGRPGGAALWGAARGLTRRAEWATAWGSPTCTQRVGEGAGDRRGSTAADTRDLGETRVRSKMSCG